MVHAEVGTGAGVAHSEESHFHVSHMPLVGPLAVPWAHVWASAHHPQLPTDAVVQLPQPVYCVQMAAPWHMAELFSVTSSV